MPTWSIRLVHQPRALSRHACSRACTIAAWYTAKRTNFSFFLFRDSLLLSYSRYVRVRNDPSCQLLPGQSFRRSVDESVFYSTSIPSLDFRESQTGETPMRRSSLVDSYIGHVGERERETVKERRGDSTQGLSLEREKDRSPRERNGKARLSFVAAGTSVEETLAFFQHFVHLRSPSGRERENRARRATHERQQFFARPTDRPLVRSNHAFIRCESNIGEEEGGKFANTTDQMARLETAKLLSPPCTQVFPYFQAKLPLTLFPSPSPGPTRYCRVSRLRNEKTSISRQYLCRNTDENGHLRMSSKR